MRTLMITGLLLAAAGGPGAARDLGPQPASPAAGHVTVSGVRLERAASGSYRVRGTVRNSGARVLDGVCPRVRASFHGPDGALLFGDHDHLATALPIGQRRRFRDPAPGAARGGRLGVLPARVHRRGAAAGALRGLQRPAPVAAMRTTTLAGLPAALPAQPSAEQVPGPRGAPVPASHVSEIRQILTRQVLPRVEASCPPWTDHPIDAADTPVKPLHIAELRRCIDRILGVDWQPGEHVTVANVRLEASGPGTFRYVKGTIRNSGSASFGGFPKVWARFYDAANLLVAQDFDYVRPAATFPAGAQQTFSILLETSDTRGWAYYRLAFTVDDDRPISCSGCGEQRRSRQRQP